MSKVFVAWLHPGKEDAAFTASALGLQAWDFSRALHRGLEQQLAGMRPVDAHVNIAGPRNGIVAEFLDRPEWGDWLLQIDADMTFDPDCVERMLETADPETAPIVGGLCFGATDGQIWPTLYDLTEDADGPYLVRQTKLQVGGLQKVTATGGAFLMVHRTVYEKVLAAGFNKAFPWFQETELAGAPCGEDLTFCLRAGMCGFPVHVNTTVRVGHVKQTLLTLAKFMEQAHVEPVAPAGVKVIEEDQ